jgi:hypothetical protein
LESDLIECELFLISESEIPLNTGLTLGGVESNQSSLKTDVSKYCVEEQGTTRYQHRKQKTTMDRHSEDESACGVIDLEHDALFLEDVDSGTRGVAVTCNSTSFLYDSFSHNHPLGELITICIQHRPANALSIQRQQSLASHKLGCHQYKETTPFCHHVSYQRPFLLEEDSPLNNTTGCQFRFRPCHHVSHR